MLLDVTLVYLKLLGVNTIMKILLWSNENDYNYTNIHTYDHTFIHTTQFVKHLAD